MLKCKIRGIRTEQRVDGEPYADTGMRWVKIEGSNFRVEKEKMIEWLSYFGEITSEITEDTHEGSDDSADDLPPCGNGIYSVRMKVKREMPQFMPMYGKRIRLYYRGIVKRCSNCFHAHMRSQCRNTKVTWPEYVRGFNSIFPEIPCSMYGKWGRFLQGQSEENGPATSEVQVESHDSSTAEHQGRSELTSQKNGEEKRSNVEAEQSKSGKKAVDSTQRKTKQTKTAEAEGLEEKEQEEDIGEEDTDDDEDLLNLVRTLRASGISKSKIKQTLKAGSKKDLKVGRGRGRGRGRV